MATSRLSSWGRQASFREEAVGSELPVVAENEFVDQRLPSVTPAMLDEAADEVLKDVDVATAHVVRNLWSYDTTSDAAVAYFRTKIEQAQYGKYNQVDRPQITLPYTLDDKAVKDLNVYAPDFTLVYRETMLHDHSVGAACRKIDQQILMSRIPPGLGFRDLGGNVVYHVQAGSRRMHKCGELEDSKDPVRSALTELRIQQLLKGNTLSEVGRQTAAGVLRKDPDVVCGKSAQACEFQAPVSISVHVYDIRMADWPMIMERSQTRVHEGCVHFSDLFFSQLKGELPISRARYEIDIDRDEFRMGFQGSPADWYTHKWSEFMLYGADQVLYSATRTYSYKIIERRGDTLFFRILQMDSRLRPERNQVYKLPDVDMVEVLGFELNSPGKQSRQLLSPRKYIFPAALWNHMLVRATADVERGSLDYNKLFDYYRTIAPRQTINAVCVMGGQRVRHEDLVPLVIMSALVAFADTMGVQRTVREVTTATQVNRSLAQETVVFKAFDAFLGALSGAGYLAVLPFKFVADRVTQAYLNSLKASLVTWMPQERYVRINVSLLVNTDEYSYQRESADQPVFMEHMQDMETFALLDVAKKNPDLASLILAKYPAVLPDALASELRDVVGVERTTVTGSQAGTSVTAVPENDQQAHRVAAIKEALEEVKLEADTTLAFSERTYREVVLSGGPDVDKLRAQAERLRNTDIWYVEQGFLCYSALGQEVDSVQHAAAYVPRIDEYGNHMQVIDDHTWKGRDGETGQLEVRQYKRISDVTYTGYVLVSDQTLIFNGPAVEKALVKALSLPHDYTIDVQCGPPGCGKTYAILQRVQQGDAVMCPVRESIRDTRDKLAGKWKVDEKSLRSLVRTVDSFLVNYERHRLDKSPSVLYGDECYMTSAGRWYAVCALLGVKRMMGFGDPFQIPHIPRVQVSSLHVKLVADREEWTYMIYRCPAVLVAAWAHVYDHCVRTASAVDGYFQRVYNTKGSVVPRGCVMMCMYQADKVTLKMMYSQSLDHISILTSHESEGKTYDDVWLHNFEVRVRPPDDPFYLFWKQAHCLVAASRSRRGVLYVKQRKDDDLITRWIERSQDPRRLAAVRDVKSVGQVKEFG